MPEIAKTVYRNLTILYGATFAFVAGTIAIIMLDKGLTIPQIGLYFALYSIVVFLLEVPTGAFADVYGRKNAIILSFVFQIIFWSGFLLLEKGAIFVGFAIFAAIADSFFSGSAEAHVVDILNERKQSRYIHQLLASGKVCCVA